MIIMMLIMIIMINMMTTMMLTTLAQLDVCERLGASDGREESSKEDFEDSSPK